MVVDAVIRHWMMVVNPIEVGTGGLGLEIIYLVAYLYANNGLVESNQLERLHREFDFLSGLFYQVCLCTNTENMVGMVCQPCHAPGRMSEEAYNQRTTGKGPTFRGSQRRRLE